MPNSRAEADRQEKLARVLSCEAEKWDLERIPYDDARYLLAPAGEVMEAGTVCP